MADKLNIAFFGSSLVSSQCNDSDGDGAADYCRGIIRGLTGLGHRVTFYEPDMPGRTSRCDLGDPPRAKAVAYRADSADDAIHTVFTARDADVVIKAGEVEATDHVLEREMLELQDTGTIVAFWDTDPARTLARINGESRNRLAQRMLRYDCILTHGGGRPIVQAYTALGAPCCLPIYRALDAAAHFPVASDPRYWCDLVFLGDRLPQRERAVEEFFFLVAECLPERVFLLAGNGWESRSLPRNVIRLGRLPASEHNALHCSATAVLSLSGGGTAAAGLAPAPGLFAAAGAAACIISDAWDGIEAFLEPGSEVLVASKGADVVDLLEKTHREDAEMIGAAARRRILSEHTYAQRAILLTRLFERLKRERAAAGNRIAVATTRH